MREPSLNEPCGHTCPMIDSTIDAIKTSVEKICDAESFLSDLIGRSDALEKIREANHSLREWGNSLAEYVEYQNEQIEEKDSRIAELEAELAEALASKPEGAML